MCNLRHSKMSTKFKGICKGFMCNFSQIFEKEREMEIGYPTDVTHVTHIGWDNNSTNSPSWMNKFKTAADFSSPSLSFGEVIERNHVTGPTWGSQDFEQSVGHTRQASDNPFLKDSIPSDLPKAQKKHKRKKNKSTYSPKSSSTSTTLRHSSSRLVAKSKSSLMATTVSELDITPRYTNL